MAEHEIISVVSWLAFLGGCAAGGYVVSIMIDAAVDRWYRS